MQGSGLLIRLVAWKPCVFRHAPSDIFVEWFRDGEINPSEARLASRAG
jgi:hypothetical protein